MYRIGVLLAAMLLTAHALGETSPYRSEVGREIKALSADDQRALLEGQGMGLARAAELNGYPGPRHVLDAAAELGLSEPQLAATQALFEAMRARAVALGERVIERERELDRLFASARADAAPVRVLLDEIGRLNAQLRYTHLEAHLAQKRLLDEHQVMRYQTVRGYATGGHAHGAGH